MPRTSRAAIGGVVYHVLNRGNGRMKIFRKPGDYRAFADLIVQAKERARIEIFDFCLMPNHWHLVVRPRGDGDLAAYFSWLTNTHVRRYRSHYRRTSGHLYQGRYKSFAVEEDGHLLSLLRYVEANPLRAKMVQRAQDWRWSGLGCQDKLSNAMLDDWPIDRPRNWTVLVNEPIEGSERERVKLSFERGQPLGTAAWTLSMAERMGVEYTLNPRETAEGKGRDVKSVDVTFSAPHLFSFLVTFSAS